MQSCTPKDTICGIKKTKLRCNSFVASFFVKQNALSVLLRNPPLPEWEAFARLFINTLRQGGDPDIDTDLDADEHNGPYVIDIPNRQWWKFSLKYRGNQGNFVAKGGKLGIKGRNFASNIQSMERKIEKLHRRTRFGYCTIPFAHKVYRTSGGKCVLCVQIDSTQRFELPTTAVGQKFVQRGVQSAWEKLGGKVHPWWRKHKTQVQREIDSEKSLFFVIFDVVLYHYITPF